MKTYSIFGAVGVGLFTLVVVCARGQGPKHYEPSPLEDGSILTPHEATYVEPNLLRGETSHPVPNAELWATYCQEKVGHGRSPYRQWHPLSALCSLFKFPSFAHCGCDDCTSCSSKAGKSGDLFSGLFGKRKQCNCPKCSGYAHHEEAPKPAASPQPPVEATPSAPAPAAEPTPIAPVPLVDLTPVDEDPAPVPPRDLEPIPPANPPVDVVPPNAVPHSAPQAEKPEIPRNEIPTRETKQSSRRSQAKFAGFRLSDFIKTD